MASSKVLVVGSGAIGKHLGWCLDCFDLSRALTFGCIHCRSKDCVGIAPTKYPSSTAICSSTIFTGMGVGWSWRSVDAISLR
jgi:hypothetical protein